MNKHDTDIDTISERSRIIAYPKELTTFGQKTDQHVSTATNPPRHGRSLLA